MSGIKLEVLTSKKKILVDFIDTETVLDLKNRIYANMDINVPPYKQRLYYIGVLLEDSYNLECYNIDPARFNVVMIHDGLEEMPETSLINKLTQSKSSEKHKRHKVAEIFKHWESQESITDNSKDTFKSNTNKENRKQDVSASRVEDFNENKCQKVKKEAADATAKETQTCQIQNERKKKNLDYETWKCMTDDVGKVKSIFSDYFKKKLFWNLVMTMKTPSDTTHDVDIAIQKLGEAHPEALDLIHENLTEFLILCAEPEKIGDAV